MKINLNKIKALQSKIDDCQRELEEIIDSFSEIIDSKYFDSLREENENNLITNEKEQELADIINCIYENYSITKACIDDFGMHVFNFEKFFRREGK